MSDQNALLIQNSLSSRANESMSHDSFEMVTAELNTFPENGEKLLVSALYKDHAIKKSDFLNGMKAVFRKRHQVNSLIMGDFNFDMKKDEALADIASSEGFYPLVTSGTTIHGSLLDQIFVNDAFFRSGLIKIEILQSYFSDHDLVVACLRKK